jgi:hypothetical protein
MTNAEAKDAIAEFQDLMTEIRPNHPRLQGLSFIVALLVKGGLSQDVAEKMVAMSMEELPGDFLEDFDLTNSFHEALAATFADLLLKVWNTTRAAGIQNPLNFIEAMR